MKKYWNTRKISGIVSIINIGIAIGYLGLVTIAFTRDLSWRADFTAFYMGGTIVRQGLGAQLYNTDLQFYIQHSILAGYPHGDGILSFNYPPHVAFLFVPLSFLPLKIAYICWTFEQMALLTGLVIMLWRHTARAGWPNQKRLLLLTTIVAMPSMLITLQLGTFSLLMLLCIVGLYDSVKNNRYYEAAGWIVLGSVKPQVMLLPAMALLFSKRWRILGYAVGVMSLIIVFSSLLLGWDTWLNFITFAFITHSQGLILGVESASMINLTGVLAGLLDPERTELVNNVGIVAYIMAGMITTTLWFTLGKRKNLYDLIYGLTILLGLLLGLHVNPQDGLFICAPAYFLYNHMQQSKYTHLRAFELFLVLCPLSLLIYKYTMEKILFIKAPIIMMMILAGWILLQIKHTLKTDFQLNV